MADPETLQSDPWSTQRQLTMRSLVVDHQSRCSRLSVCPLQDVIANNLVNPVVACT